MDPMDFTMDDSMNVTSPNRYQCQPQQTQPQPPPNGSGFALYGQPQHATRESQSHYDPVHDSSTSAWYSSNLSSNTPHRPAYANPPHYPSWPNSPPQMGQDQRWAQFAEMERMARIQDYTTADYRRSYMPWDQSRGNEGSSGLASAAASTSASIAAAAIPQSRLAGAATAPRNYGMEQQQLLRDMWQGNVPSIHGPMPASIASSEFRPGHDNTNISPASEITMRHRGPATSGLGTVVPVGRRRPIVGWDSDEEDEPVSLAEFRRQQDERVRRRAEAALLGEFDDERSIAALRGVIAAAKRVPSRAAIEALEIVKVDELKEADRSCIICYNEFGISNPEGEIEKPIRLPKCKHVFGDKCIKKWFEDSDSCPYCRDKLPSELLATKKGLANYAQSYRIAHREHMRLAVAASRARTQTGQAHSTSLSDAENARTAAVAQRVHEDYELMMARQMADGWNFPRGTSGDSPERRRQARGRHAHSTSRAPHYLSRPTSVGSARSTPALSHQAPRGFADYSYVGMRRNAGPNISGSEAREDARERQISRDAASDLLAHLDRRAPPPDFPDPVENGSMFRTVPPQRLPPATPAPVEEASPPVAVGSGVAARPQSDQQQNQRSSVGSLDSDFAFDSAGHNQAHNTINGEGRAHYQNHRNTYNGSGSLLDPFQLGPRSRFSDSSSDVDDLARNTRMDNGISPGWSGIN